jgi:carbon-monoxide dehydrogenase catalytic subunit
LTENAAFKLRGIANKNGELAGVETLERLSAIFGIKRGNKYDKANYVAQAILNDLYRPANEKMLLWELFAENGRRDTWHGLGIAPGGGKSEVVDALIKTGTNLNSDPIDMLLHCLRLGIVTGFYGLMFTNYLNDIMIGEPVIHEAASGFGVIDPDSINIMIVGHQISLYKELFRKLNSPKCNSLAQKIGAKRISLIGSTCVGQDFRSRCPVQGEGFCGYAGNNFATEPILLTGCVDLVLSEFNCTLPGIDAVCEKMDIPQICFDAVAKTARSKMAGDSDAGLDEILELAADSYKKRSGGVSARKNVMAAHGRKQTLAGISEISLKQFLGGNWKPLIDLLASGAIQGIAGVVGCSNLHTMGYDVHTVELTKHLIAKDILVLSAGCTSGCLANLGFMNKEAASLAGGGLRIVCETLGIPPVLDVGPCLGIARMEIIATEIASALGVDIPKLPVVLSAPQWLEEQALADGAFGLALGFNLHLGSAPFVTGSKLILSVLTEQMESLTGGKLIVETDPAKAAESLAGVIANKRKGLSI